MARIAARDAHFYVVATVVLGGGRAGFPVGSSEVVNIVNCANVVSRKKITLLHRSIH